MSAPVSLQAVKSSPLEMWFIPLELGLREKESYSRAWPGSYFGIMSRETEHSADSF